MIHVLSPFLYFRRNLGKSLPVSFVILLAVVLVASVVSIVHSIDLTVYTLYGYNRYLTAMTPRNGLSIPDDQQKRIAASPDLGAIYLTHSYQTMVKTMFGKMPFPVFGVEARGLDEMMRRCGLHLIGGRLPTDGAPEAAISDNVARSLGIGIGDVIFRPDSQDSYAPISIRLVGLFHGPVWLGLTTKSLVDANSPFSFTGLIAFSRDPSDTAQRRLDREITNAVDPGEVRVWKYSGLIEETRSALSNLYLIMNLVIGIIVFAISFVCGLLSNIYFSQRLPEVATLSAIGYSRSTLVRRALGETSLLCAIGWLLGAAVTVALLLAIRAVFLTPRVLLNPVDIGAFAETIPLPIAITLFAVVTIAHRLATLDPVSIIERRA